MARTACSEACLAVYLRENLFSVSRAIAAHVTALLSSGRAARSRRKSQLAYFMFGSVAQLPGNSVWSFVPFQPFQPGRMNSHTLTPLFMGAESCEKSESLQTFFATFLMYALYGSKKLRKKF